MKAITVADGANSLLVRDVYNVCFLEVDGIDSLHGDFARMREAFFTGGRKPVKVSDQRVISGYEGKLRGKMGKTRIFWRKSAGSTNLEESFDYLSDHILVKKDFQGIITARIFFDKEHRWLKSEYYQAWNPNAAKVIFKPQANSDQVIRFDYDEERGHYICTTLHPFPYLGGSEEQSVLSARLGEPKLIITTDQGEFCYCTPAELEAREKALAIIRGEEEPEAQVWQALGEEMEAENESEAEPDVIFPGLNEYAKVIPAPEEEHTEIAQALSAAFDEPEEEEPEDGSDDPIGDLIDEALAYEAVAADPGQLEGIPLEAPEELEAPETEKHESRFSQQNQDLLSQARRMLFGGSDDAHEAEPEPIAEPMEALAAQPVEEPVLAAEDEPVLEIEPAPQPEPAEPIVQAEEPEPVYTEDDEILALARRYLDGFTEPIFEEPEPEFELKLEPEPEPIVTIEEEPEVEPEPEPEPEPEIETEEETLDDQVDDILAQLRQALYGSLEEEDEEDEDEEELPGELVLPEDYDGSYPLVVEKGAVRTQLTPDGFNAKFYQDGTLSYAGSTQDGKRSGLGVSFRKEDHALHIANWTAGKPDPVVSLFDKDGNLRYGGRIENGKKQGAGVSLRQADGSVFVGQWKDGEPTGIGAFIDPDGCLLYYGGWKNGKRWGHGTQFDRSGKVVYNGEWRDGKYYNGTLFQELAENSWPDDVEPPFEYNN